MATVGRMALIGSLLAICLPALAGCGAAEGGGEGGRHPDYEKALAGAPAPLAALYRQESELLDGGADAFERRIAELRGHPVVVNVWASWCGPCRFEFPSFQRLSARYGKRVAFIGVDREDSEDAARTFLSDNPVPYPSYSDPDSEINELFGDPRGLPDTAFYDRRGELVYVKQGQYPDEAALRADIERCALANDCESG
jgi:thiol-disulfide isomerase/thioredoxin